MNNLKETFFGIHKIRDVAKFRVVRNIELPIFDAKFRFPELNFFLEFVNFPIRTIPKIVNLENSKNVQFIKLKKNSNLENFANFRSGKI